MLFMSANFPDTTVDSVLQHELLTWCRAEKKKMLTRRRYEAHVRQGIEKRSQFIADLEIFILRQRVIQINDKQPLSFLFAHFINFQSRLPAFREEFRRLCDVLCLHESINNES